VTAHQALPQWAGWAGPRDARMVLVGEAWGESEAHTRQPFVGASGQELWRMLGEAMPEVAPAAHAAASARHRYGDAWVRSRAPWLAAAGIAMTNVLALRPPANRVDALCVPRAEVPPDYPEPALARGLYLRMEYLPEIARLQAELAACRPNLVVPLGNTACWALLGSGVIGSIRGTVIAREGAPKALPTYHPAAVLRQWSWRPITVADLMKAHREAEFPEVRRPRREIAVSPLESELAEWVQRVHAEACASGLLMCDIETRAGTITCISFAGNPGFALVIPFADPGHPSGSYWPTPAAERNAWDLTRWLLESHAYRIGGQNFVYDLQYLTRMGIRPWRCEEDTMLLHHALYPEMQKGLGFLGSVYSSEPAWKLMRRQRADTVKRDE
jgi:uracil-DNA glycosylase